MLHSLNERSGNTLFQGLNGVVAEAELSDDYVSFPGPVWRWEDVEWVYAVDYEVRIGFYRNGPAKSNGQPILFYDGVW